MKNITKILLTPLFIGATLLSSCSGTGLVNEKKTSKEEFFASIIQTPENVYPICREEGRSLVNVEEKKYQEYNLELSWDDKSKSYVSMDATYFPVLHVSVEVEVVLKILEICDAVDQAQYFIADNGYRFHCEVKGDVIYPGGKGTCDVSVNYVYNIYGYPTMMKSTIYYVVGTNEGNTSIDFKFSYK